MLREMKKILLILISYLSMIYLLLLLLLIPLSCFAQKEAVIHVNTDNYPQETRWVMYADSVYGSIIGDVQYGHYNQSDSLYTDTLLIADSLSNISFVIYDSFGDGMSPPGSYYVSVCNDTIIQYPTPSFTTGLIHNRVVPQCMPNPPPGPCVPTMLNINLDQFQGETTWEIQDTLGNLLYAGGPYAQAPDYQPQFEPICLPLGPLKLIMYDSYGDGLSGSQWGGQDGSYYLIQCQDTLVYGDVPNFGLDTSHVFISDTCPPPPNILGCTDDDYIEYNSLANTDDGSCLTLKIYGCIDSTMFNYDTLANSMDYIDSCSYTLTLYDLAGNGWVGSKVEIYHQSDTSMYNLSYGYSQSFSLNLLAPEEVRAKFFITAQASGTAIECGFSLISSTGDTTIHVPGGFASPIMPFYEYVGQTYCGNECIPIITGCMDSAAYNYDSFANTQNTCYYLPGCTSPAYLEYYTQGFVADINNSSCNTLAMFGCTDILAFNYDSIANVDNGGCVPVVIGCMQPLAFNYNPLANTPNVCIPFIYGCTSPIAFNYNPLANTDDNSCVPIIMGCTDSTAFNWYPLANVDDGDCEPIIYGCVNPIMYNYCDTCNTNNGSCIPFVYGCTDSTMFNFNPLANADNNSCIPYIYGCTDPSMLNYNPSANSEDFSCISYIYGCMDNTALNYDSLANTDNGSCISVVEGCMEADAYNYNPEANIDDSNCLYDAECITGPGNPYWLNDECYAWVISVDDYCCENEWDDICQLTYGYCFGTWTGERIKPNDLITYPNPTTGLVNFSETVDVDVYDFTGRKIIEKNNVNKIDLSEYSSGIYNIITIFGDKINSINLIKQ